ncbi:hypothetical protein BD289DRAFT_467327 [Coniella lustricola]|uniref:Uncharacterized protein n=1 Tax=Coniella lustricola TaxID=2025994 RepID=A0A2T3A835_9PEZI|nr:hypothetical protein BD289DRAFT_467327 [Coniella lustricola]
MHAEGHILGMNGSCTYGAECKFSHDHSSAESKSRPGSSLASTRESDQPYNDWKHIFRRKPIGGVAKTALSQLWSGAVTILDGSNREWHQQLARDLVDDRYGGCEYVHITLHSRLSASPESIYVQLKEDFLRTITHPSILSCLSVDTYIGTLYNVMSGVNGDMAISFLLDFCSAILVGSSPTTSATDHAVLSRRAAVVLEALNELLLREKRASLNEHLAELFDQLDNITTLLDDPLGSAVYEYNNNNSKGRVDQLRKIVELSTGRLVVPDTENCQEKSGIFILPQRLAHSLAFPVEMPIPGTRHDNDHLSIADISIVPTANEILCDQPDYLPSTDCRQPHFLQNPAQRHIDTHFRLLRHDIFDSLKTTVHPLLHSAEACVNVSSWSKGNVNAHFYRDAIISHISVHEKRGFEMILMFSVTHIPHAKTTEERRRWWTESKTLEPGSLICLVSPVAEEAVPLLLIVVEKCTKSDKDGNQGAKRLCFSIVAKSACFRESDLRHGIMVYRRRIRGTLVAVPGLVPATFTPVLGNLQEMLRAPQFPFQKWIVPDLNTASIGKGAGRSRNMVPPSYAQRNNFTFPLSSIVTGDNKNLCIAADASEDDPTLIDQLENQTSLDRGQCRALVSALTREYALIQGPPGTGKSYLGVKIIQALLACKDKARFGPILVICYTNHALDQFLLHLLHVGINKIIRIGGHSQASELDGYNLRVVSDHGAKTKNESSILGNSYGSIQANLKSAGWRLSTLHRMKQGSAGSAVKRFLALNHPEIHTQLYELENGGFKEVPGKMDAVQSWVNPLGGKEKTDEPHHRLDESATAALVVKAEHDIQSLSLPERRLLLDTLLLHIEQDNVARVLDNLQGAEESRSKVEKVHCEIRRRSLLNADIVGITTTGLAKEISTIRNLRSKVVLVEEAAEVHEAHILSALMPGIEHFIQIGDHLQLRPQINNFSLSLESAAGKMYQLDRSQFERLALGEPGLAAVPVAQLSIQRRMRPEISRLIRKTMYPSLQDHGAVLDLPDVLGMRDNVFWLNHSHPEDSEADPGRNRSHSNKWEVNMTTALVRHLIRQGLYKADDIAVLTPYSGQLIGLRASLNSEFHISLNDRDEEALALEGLKLDDEEGPTKQQVSLQKKKLCESLRLATVDNFQGEEAKVVIVSLVRSNAAGKVGFLKTKNRINVLLSRAQHGMYLIGNADTYGNVPMWVEIRRQLDEDGAVGPGLRLCCPRHKEMQITCAVPEDFTRLSPEGGCQEPCNWRLTRCGHQCLTKCHSEAMHSAFSCPRPCVRRRATCDHACSKLCGEECGPCQVLLNGIKLPCGHFEDSVSCFRTNCLAGIKCSFQVEKTVPNCGHRVKVPCYQDVESAKFPCPEACMEILECGHRCPGSCSRCNVRTEDDLVTVKHQHCTKLCGRPRNTCSHVCGQRCHAGQPCPPCKTQCEVRCAHSRCTMSCNEGCTPCIEKCAWSCDHQGSCSMPCAAPCNRLPCDRRCCRTLGCGHQCPGLCGEHCPQGYCQVCGEKPDARVDLLEFKQYQEIDLDETPIVVLGCGHFFTAESLDGLARLGEVYAVDSSSGKYCGLLDSSVVLPVPCCPDCKAPLRQFSTQRYNRVVNASVMEQASKRCLVKGQKDLQDLEKKIEGADQALQKTLGRALSAQPDPLFELTSRPTEIVKKQAHTRQRYAPLKKLLEEALELQQAMDIEQQPSKKLFDAILKEQAANPLGMDLSGSMQYPAPERRLTFGAHLAILRIQALIFQDQCHFPKGHEVLKMLGKFLPLQIAGLSLKDCQALYIDCSKNMLPRYAVMCSLVSASIALSLRTLRKSYSVDAKAVEEHTDSARKMLQEAKELCTTSPFEGARQLTQDINAAFKLLRSEWYEEVTAEELQSIKLAMVSGAGGIQTHSGHWYKCQNGHAFAIGECGMPMEQARCPECGAPIGGQNHQFLATVTRAEEMER